MLCQNCNEKEATMHMKRIVNGNAAELHLCADCARSLGYGETFPVFGLGDLLGEFFHKGELGAASAVKCPACGKSFEEIAADGKMGCAECYNTFYDKLMPSLRRIHGKSTHVGKIPQQSAEPDGARVKELKEQLAAAVEEQNFELAARLRDEINGITLNGGDAK